MLQKFILDQIIKVIFVLSKTAILGTRITRTLDTVKLGNLLIRVQRRSKLGKDGGLSEIVKIIKNGVTEEVWHIVTRSGKIIHQHLKYKR